jgi:tetratricopeptide (TPR) repeat protein
VVGHGYLTLIRSKTIAGVVLLSAILSAWPGLNLAQSSGTFAARPFGIRANLLTPLPAAQKVTVDYPEEDAIFPRDLAPPLFQWRDAAGEATIWRIDIDFGRHKPHIELWSPGATMTLPPVDESLVGYVPPKLTPEQESGHTWRPDEKTWETVRKNSIEQPAVVRISGYRNDRDHYPISTGQVTIHTSKDPVGAPIFYRDVPQLPPDADVDRGVIKPLDDSLLPSIKWHLRDVSKTESKVVMTGLPTCANCHSVARDGKTLGIDIDGPQNDKGLYALVPLQKHTSISSQYIIQWSASSEVRAQKRYGFMPQVSPDGRFVIASIEPSHSTGSRVRDRLYSINFHNYGFTQVFYPTRGVLGWYSKDTHKLVPLPGADDPNYVHTSGFWSPDGKYIIFSRAVATDPYEQGKPRAMYANDPNETQVKYDLYRIPFNDGKGGTPERVVGASENGMSNNFPKVSPDGKWIVFVQCRNGLLMRPDSKLYIVPFAGGEARPLRSNLATMNSWHSFSPNGRWLVFSSKSQAPVDSSKEPSLYTRMYLTHIDEQGNSSPAIRVENATASNRAVNIPEFVNTSYESLESIDAPATDFYRLFDQAVSFESKHRLVESIATWRRVLEIDSSDPRAHDNFGVALAEAGHNQDAIAEYTKSLELNPNSSQTENNLGSALAEAGRLASAEMHFAHAIAINPDNASAQVNMGKALAAHGDLSKAITHFEMGLALEGDSAQGQTALGVALALEGKLDQAIPHLQRATELDSQNAVFRFNLGRAYAAARRFADALDQLEEAAKQTNHQDPSILQMLAAMYFETGHTSEALSTVQLALDQAVEGHSADLASALRSDQQRYRGLTRSAGN